MGTSLYTVRIDTALKKKAQKTAKDLGLPLSIVINRSLRDFIAKRSMQFPEVTPRPWLVKALKRVEEDIRLGREMSPVFTNAKDAIAYLKSP